MNVEVKNLKVVDSLSEGTLCFSATLYLDGVRAGNVGNRGRGGPNEYTFQDPELRD